MKTRNVSYEEYQNLVMERDCLKERVSMLENCCDQAYEYLTNVGLHTEDHHVHHFVDMAMNWLDIEPEGLWPTKPQSITR